MLRGRCDPRGSSLASTLLLSALVITLAFTAASVGFSHFHLTRRLGNADEARNLAEAAISRAVERVLATEGAYGKAGTPEETITVSFPSASPGAEGILTFDPATAAGRKIPRSTNNMDGEDPVPGDGRQIPGQAIHLLAVGRAGGAERRVEAILSMTPFRQAIACSGPFRSGGGLYVAGVESPADLAAGVDRIPAEKIRNGNVASNATAEAVVLDSTPGNPSHVTGDVRAPGTIRLAADTTVDGEIRANADPLKLPRVTAQDFDPGANAVPIQNETYPSLTVARSVQRRSGNLTLTGPLTMESGILYVDGDLSLAKGVQGTGAIIASGAIGVLGEGSLEATQKVAVIAGRDLRIVGTDKDASFFQGVVYSGGHIELRDVTFVGMAVGNSTEPGGSEVTVDRANIVHLPVGQDLTFDFDLPLSTQTKGTWTEVSPNVALGDFFDESRSRFVFPEPVLVVVDEKTGSQEWMVDLPSGGRKNLFSYTTKPIGSMGNVYGPYPGQSRDAALFNDSVMRDRRAISGGRTEVVGMEQAVTDDIRKAIQQADEVWQKTHDRKAVGKFSFDPNRFLQIETRNRVILWREL